MMTSKMFSASAIGFAIELVVACGGGESPASPGSDTGSGAGGSSGSGGGPATTADAADDTTTTSAVDGTSSSGPASTSEVGGSSDTAEQRECPGETRCIELPGEPWHGPITVMGASSPSGRPCDAEALRETAYDSLVVPEPVCTCTCGMEGTPGCSTALLRYYESGNCAGDPVDEWTITESCNSTIAPTVAFGGSWRVPNVPQDGATCEANATTTIGEAGFAEQFELCEMPIAGGCEDASVCIEDQLGGICVWREGDFPCPGDFIARQVRYRQFVDDRGCSPCTCPSLSWGCDGAVQLFAVDDCHPTLVYGEVEFGDCVPSTFSLTATPSATLGPVTPPPGLSCDGAQGGEAYGTAGVIDPVTICCQ